MTTFQPVALYGGAISVNLPTGYIDVSTIRQVPDHQEVYLASTGFTSVVFDLTERVLDAQDDLEALERHLADILGEDDHADQRVKRSQDVTVTQPDKLPQPAPAYTILLTIESPSQSPSPSSYQPQLISTSTPATTMTAIVTLIRLTQTNTDVVITINVPHVGEGDSNEGNMNQDQRDLHFGSNITQAVQIKEEILRTFEVKDWDLFCSNN